jgi:glycosyltransferase involved in cell wall biosynthesis
MNDYRNSEYILTLTNFIKENQLETNIFLLGLVSSNQLYSLMYKSLCVINPSLFEGWSTTVEECKTMDKLMIVSDIKVHKEQNPKGYYFNPSDFTQLSKIMKDIWFNTDKKQQQKSISDLRNDMKNKLIHMGKTYESIINSLFSE